MKRLLALSLILAMTASCRPIMLQTVDPSGTPEYNLGWEDGCDTGLSAEGSWQYKMMYGFKKRPEMADNELYKTAWNEGFTYCRFSLDPVDKSQWFN